MSLTRSQQEMIEKILVSQTHTINQILSGIPTYELTLEKVKVVLSQSNISELHAEFWLKQDDFLKSCHYEIDEYIALLIHKRHQAATTIKEAWRIHRGFKMVKDNHPAQSDFDVRKFAKISMEKLNRNW